MLEFLGLNSEFKKTIDSVILLKKKKFLNEQKKIENHASMDPRQMKVNRMHYDARKVGEGFLPATECKQEIPSDSWRQNPRQMPESCASSAPRISSHQNVGGRIRQDSTCSSHTPCLVYRSPGNSASAL